MNHYLYAYVAMDIAQQRTREAEQLRLEHALHEGAPERNNALRRVAARAMASVSLGSASIARKLDGHVADDLGRTLAPAE